MYRGFDLRLHDFENERYLKKGKEIARELYDDIEDSCENFIEFDGVIDGNKVIENWFPSIEFDVFLSHSHRDRDLALSFAGFLKEEFNLEVFIDSAVWGHSNELIDSITQHYPQEKKKKASDLEKIINIISHVNLMLKSALDKMIDNCEVIFFLNTPNSVSLKNSVQQKTNSPWIFSEIATTQVIRKKTPERLKKQTKIFANMEGALMMERRNKLTIQYELELNNFTELTRNDINKWRNKFQEKHSIDKLFKTHTFRYLNMKYKALDILYELKPLDKKFMNS